MEDVMRRSSHGGGNLVKEEKPADSCARDDDLEVACGDEAVDKVGRKRAYHETEDLKPSLSELNKDLSLNKQVISATNNKERSIMESDSKASSSSQKEQDCRLESARTQVGEIREENQRLKMCLSQMMKDYHALQMKFYDIIQQDQETKKSSTSTVDNDNNYHHHHQAAADQEPELVSLSLGRFSSESKKEEKGKTCSSQVKFEDEKANKNDEGLSLRLECNFGEVSKSHANEASTKQISPVNSLDEPKEEAGETWPPNKVLKTMPSGEDEVLQQNSLKKARVCVRARCDTPTMNDGCQWRKYGQKIAKGNPCPRAYYRCTVAPSCPVRKQVQRCAEEMSILVTTYEGTHNHPLPLSATAMASATSAAASMLLSGSSSSASQTGTNTSSTTTTAADHRLHGLNFYQSDSSNSKQFYLHNSSLSASPSHPTITLDLTNSNPASLSSTFNRFSSIPKFSTTSTLNFSSFDQSHAMPWGSNNGFLTYGNSSTSTTSQPYNRNQFGILNLGRPPTIENNHFQTYMQKNIKTPTPGDSTIAAASKVITADPSFQSALAAALTSIIGTGSGGAAAGGVGATVGGGDHLGHKVKWGENFPVVASGYSSSISTSPNLKSNSIACATSYLNKTTSANSQPASLMFLQPPNPLPFSCPKSASAPPGDNRDNAN